MSFCLTEETQSSVSSRLKPLLRQKYVAARSIWARWARKSWSGVGSGGKGMGAVAMRVAARWNPDSRLYPKTRGVALPVQGKPTGCPSQEVRQDPLRGG